MTTMISAIIKHSGTKLGMQVSVYYVHIKLTLNLGCHAHRPQKSRILCLKSIYKAHTKEKTFGLLYLRTWLKCQAILRILNRSSNKYIVFIGNCKSILPIFEYCFQFLRHFLAHSNVILKLSSSVCKYNKYFIEILCRFLKLNISIEAKLFKSFMSLNRVLIMFILATTKLP